MSAWSKAGYTLYAGVNVPSKAFGELVEQHRHTPHVSPQEVAAMQGVKDDFVIVDGRPFGEYSKMSIPGGICCPNGELALRIKDIAPDPKTSIVVNCAGRTRSIIGAQTLIDLGVPNAVYALENGTQGWFLAGFELERGAGRRYADTAKLLDMEELRTRAHGFAAARGAGFVRADAALGWLADRSRTTYLLDVRTREEFGRSGVPGFVHAPGGQLVQATDQWIGVRGARTVLLDDEQVRAPVIAGWLRQLGHEAWVLDSGVAAAARHEWRHPASRFGPPELTPISPSETERGLHASAIQVLDLRSGMTYRRGHIPGALWGIRPRLAAVPLDRTKCVVLVADEAATAALAAVDLAEAGFHEMRRLAGGYAAWCAAGLSIQASPHHPEDVDCIDFLFFVHDRHEGNAEAARQYLAWETGLLDQLDEQERGAFHLFIGI